MIQIISRHEKRDGKYVVCLYEIDFENKTELFLEEVQHERPAEIEGRS